MHFVQTMWQWFGNVRIRWKIFLSYVVLIGLIVSVVGIFTYLSLKGEVSGRYIDALESSINRLAADIDNRLVVIEEATSVLVWQTELRDILSKPMEGYTFAEQMQDYETLQKIVKNFARNSAFTLFVNSSAIYSRELVSIFPKAESLYAQVYTGMISHGELSTWTLSATGEGLVYLQRIIHKTRLFEDVGYLACYVDASILIALMQEGTSTPGNAMYITNDKGYVMVKNRVLPVDDTIGLTLNANLSVHNGWQLTTLVPWSDLYTPSKEVAKVYAPLISIVLVVAMLLSILLSRGLTGRLTRLVAIMHGNYAGTEQPELATVVYDDEIGELQTAYNQMTQRNQKLIDQLYLVELRQREAELKALQAYINPHFLYNTLNTIHWMALEAGAPRVSGAVTLLADYFRTTLKTAGQKISLGEELEHARMYLEIQKYRLQDALEYSIEADPSLYDCPAVKLMLQPLAENAILHGIQYTPEQAGHIWIRAQRKDDTVVLVVEDDGTGFIDNPRKLNGREMDSPHLGIQNTHQRIQMAYGADYGLHYEHRECGGTLAIITLPFQNIVL